MQVLTYMPQRVRNSGGPSLLKYGCYRAFNALVVELWRLYFLAPSISPLPGSPTTVADNVASQLRSWPAGLVKVWRTEVLLVP